MPANGVHHFEINKMMNTICWHLKMILKMRKHNYGAQFSLQK